MPENNQLMTWEGAVTWLRSQPECSQLVRDAYQDDPLLDAANRYWKSEEWKAIVPFLGSRRGHAIDVGAGRGIASYALAKEGYTVSALEPDDSNLVGGGAIRSLAMATTLPISVIKSYAESQPLPDNSVDLVFARAALHHTLDLRQGCREFFRILKPGGQLVAVREHVISKPSDLPAFLDAHPLHRLYGGENAFVLAEYQAAFTSAGFAISDVIGPLKSPINYAPQTSESLREDFARRLGRTPSGRRIASAALRHDYLFRAVMKLASLIDNRPGRLYSFACEKPAAKA